MAADHPLVARGLEVGAAGAAAEDCSSHLPSSVTSGRVVSTVMACFLAKAIIIGFYLSFGSLLPALLRAFESTEFATVLVGSLAEATFNVTGLVAGRFVDRHGPVIGFAIGTASFCLGLIGDGLVRNLNSLYFTHMLVGFGMGFADLSVMGILHRHTPLPWRGTCVGISCLGAGCGMAGVSTLLAKGQDLFGLWTTFLVAAAAIAVSFGVVLMVIYWLETDPKLPAYGTNTAEVGDVPLRRYLVFFVGLTIYAVGLTVPANFIKVLALYHGVDEQHALALPIIMGIGDAVGLVAFGFIGDRCSCHHGLHTFMVFISALSLASLPTCAAKDSGGMIALSVFAVTYGAVSGGRAGLLSLVCLELAGQSSVTSVYGIASSTFVFSCVGSPFAGKMFDATGSYSVGFYILAGTTAFSLPCFVYVYLPSGLWSSAPRSSAR